MPLPFIFINLPVSWKDLFNAANWLYKVNYKIDTYNIFTSIHIKLQINIRLKTEYEFVFAESLPYNMIQPTKKFITNP